MFLTFYYFLALVLILTVHEASHAWAAYRLGDPTAQRDGRLTLNPLKHLSLLGTIMLFIAGIGWGKPVRVNPKNFKNPMRDQALTAFAGPAANLLLAFVFAIPLKYLPGGEPEWMHSFSKAVVELSIVLFLFNLLPFPPLDGSKFLGVFVPKRFQLSYLKFLQKGTPFFLVFLVIDLYFFTRVFGFSIIWTLVSTVTYWLKASILVII